MSEASAARHELNREGLTVCIDPANLSGFAALAPTLALIERFGVRSTWLPITSGLARLSARQPQQAGEDPLAAYKARRARAREQWARREMQRDCERLGISEAAGTLQYDPSVAGLAMLYLADRGGDIPAFLQRVYDAGFRRQEDIADMQTIVRLLDDAGFEEFARTGTERMTQLQDKLVEAWAFNSPSYLLEGEVYQGRQHLPLLAWQLGDRVGNPPV